jgi:hypothetical protein
MKIGFIGLILIAMTLASSFSQASNVMTLSYAGTNVTTGAYVTFGNAPITSGTIIICDNSGQIVKVAFGSVGNEVDQLTAPISSCMQVPLTINVNSGTRISLKAVNASATTGYSVISFLP